MNEAERHSFDARLRSDSELQSIVDADRHIIEAIARDATSADRLPGDPPAQLLSRLARSHTQTASHPARGIPGRFFWLAPLGALVTAVMIFLVVPLFVSTPMQDRGSHRIDTLYLPTPAVVHTEPAAIDTAVASAPVPARTPARVQQNGTTPSRLSRSAPQPRTSEPTPVAPPAYDAEAITRQLELESRNATIPVRRKDSVTIRLDVDP